LIPVHDFITLLTVSVSWLNLEGDTRGGWFIGQLKLLACFILLSGLIRENKVLTALNME